MNTRSLRFAALALGILTFSSPLRAQPQPQKSDPCNDTSNMSQRDLDDCAAKDLHKAEAELDGLLKRLGISRNSPEEKAWEAYRDAQLNALYPPGDTSDYGSVSPMCFATLKKTLTDGRIRDLKALTSSGEGEVCHMYRCRAGLSPENDLLFKPGR